MICWWYLWIFNRFWYKNDEPKLFESLVFYLCLQWQTKIDYNLAGMILLAAIKAMEIGVAGIVVSNHGARQLDYSPATITVLEQVSYVWVFLGLVDGVWCRYASKLNSNMCYSWYLILAISCGTRKIFMH